MDTANRNADDRAPPPENLASAWTRFDKETDDTSQQIHGCNRENDPACPGKTQRPTGTNQRIHPPPEQHQRNCQCDQMREEASRFHHLHHRLTCTDKPVPGGPKDNASHMEKTRERTRHCGRQHPRIQYWNSLIHQVVDSSHFFDCPGLPGSVSSGSAPPAIAHRYRLAVLP